MDLVIRVVFVTASTVSPWTLHLQRGRSKNEIDREGEGDL
jgi:hypothetical protein